MKTGADGNQTTNFRTNSRRDETSSDKVSDPLSGIVITNAYHTGENEPSTSQSATQLQNARNTVVPGQNFVNSSTSLTCLLCSEPLEKDSSLIVPKRKRRKRSGWSSARKKKKVEPPSLPDGSEPATVFARALMSFESISKIKFTETEEGESARDHDWIQFFCLTEDDKCSDNTVKKLPCSDHPCCNECYGKLKRFDDLTTNMSTQEAVENAEVNKIWEEIVANIQTKTHSSVVLPAWAPLKSSLLKFTKSQKAITTEEQSSPKAGLHFLSDGPHQGEMQHHLLVFEENEVEVGEEFLVENVKAEHSTENPSNSHLCSSSYLQSHNQENQIEDNEEIASQVAWPQFNLSSVASNFSTQSAQQSQEQSQPSTSSQQARNSLDGTAHAEMQELEACKKELECLRNENSVLKEGLKETKCQVEELQICLNLLDDKLETVTGQLDEKIENEARLKIEFDMEISRVMREHENEKKNIQAKLANQQKSNENLKQEKDKLQQKYEQQRLDLSLLKQKLEGFEEQVRKKERIRFHDACFQTEETVPRVKATDSDFEHYNLIIAERLEEESAIIPDENHQILQSFVMGNNDEMTKSSAPQPCLVLVQDTPNFNCETLPQQNQIIQFSGSRMASVNLKNRETPTETAEVVTAPQKAVETKDLENSHLELHNSDGCSPTPGDSLEQLDVDFSSEPEISSQMRKRRDYSEIIKYCKKNWSTGLYHCTICQKPLKRAYNFFLHYQAIHLNKKFNCDRCSRPFSQYAGLKVHQRTCNGEGRVNIQRRKICYTRDKVTGMRQCTKCEMKSPHCATIIAHYEKIHLKKQYKCEICNIAELTSQNRLNAHKKRCRETVEDMKKEGEEIVFVCKLCEKQFPTKLGFKMHRRVHLRNEYPCDLCKETFLYKNCYVKHLPNCLKRRATLK